MAIWNCKLFSSLQLLKLFFFVFILLMVNILAKFKAVLDRKCRFLSMVKSFFVDRWQWFIVYEWTQFRQADNFCDGRLFLSPHSTPNRNPNIYIYLVIYFEFSHLTNRITYMFISYLLLVIGADVLIYLCCEIVSSSRGNFNENTILKTCIRLFWNKRSSFNFSVRFGFGVITVSARYRSR